MTGMYFLLENIFVRVGVKSLFVRVRSWSALGAIGHRECVCLFVCLFYGVARDCALVRGVA